MNRNSKKKARNKNRYGNNDMNGNRNSKKRQGTRAGRETTTGIGTGTAREHILPWVRTFFEIENKNDSKKTI